MDFLVHRDRTLLSRLGRYGLLCLATAGLPLAGSGTACAAFPERPITIIVAFPPGGANDLTVRLLAPYLERALANDAKVEVVNKAGAGGEIGYAALAGAPGDGYTLGTINLPNLVTIPIERQARFSLDSLDPLLGLASEPAVWLVRADGPFVTLKDLLDAGAQQGNVPSIGTSGVGSRDHLGILRIEMLTGSHFVHVPFPGGMASITALAAGKLSAAGVGLGDAQRLSEKMPVRILALAARQRDPAAPDVPTFAELGIDFVSNALRAIAAPKGLPPDIRARLVTALRSAATNPAFVEASERAANGVRVQEPEEVARAINDADTAYRALWKASPWIK